jgi:hypothetical protein
MTDRTGNLNPNWKGGLVISHCLLCGVEVATKPSHAKKGEGKFCSRRCRGLYPMFRKTPAFRRGDIRNGFDFDLALYSE